MSFPEYKGFNLSDINKEIQEKWNREKTFEKSISTRETPFVFYEGPPSANGKPGIHHVMSRTIKDVICRFKTLKGFKVERKAGWDTHGLPVELQVESNLGITKEDIGKKISVEKYNEECREAVMQYTREWEELTHKMGYWVNMDAPYITYDNRYIETVWYLLKQLFDKDLLYKGYSIQPYSPAAGTGLSTHELNQPGCYRDVKDTTVVAQFNVIRDKQSEFLFEDNEDQVFILAWTTTPWTLPSNTALAVGKDIPYAKIKTYNPYNNNVVTVILAKDLVNTYFDPKNKDLNFDNYVEGTKEIPFKILDEFPGKKLENIRYDQLIDWVKPEGDAFRVVTGDFVTTGEGTGIVHIAPTFGADDHRVARQNNISALTVSDDQGHMNPLVDRKGRFFRLEDMHPEFIHGFVNKDKYGDFSGRYVKNEYDDKLDPRSPTIDVDIAVMLKKENKAFRIEKHVHNYPHCWRTDKPVLYYPLDSWFIKTTAMKERLMALNDTINWKPETTGTGRFGKWLENLVDWNLSRSRYWGTPLPIWVTEDKKEKKCIGSVEELKSEIEKSVKVGIMKENPLSEFTVDDHSTENYQKFDLHRPYVDNIVLVSEEGKPMFREVDLIDVWFDSGSMPYAQFHYPFEHKEDFEQLFPADFIAEGVDQTRGWFFTLHAIATMIFDSVAFKNIISNGLVLDKNGNKMSKRLGNAVDPFDTIEKYGSDPLRWYMITNAQPWDNLKFDISGVDEVKRKFFGTLYNTYSFFALYANVDGFNADEENIPVNERPEIDRWIISLLNSLVKEVTEHYNNYEPTKAGRAIQHFVTENLSNWYVRLNRKRFWGGEKDKDKLAAYQTLYSCLLNVAVMASPVSPFYTEKMYGDLVAKKKPHGPVSVHLANFPDYEEKYIDHELEERMGLAQNISSMILGLRRKVNIKVRQPLQKIMIPLPEKGFDKKLEAVKKLILNEVNVKELQYIDDTADILIKKIKPNYKSLGPRYGKLMKKISAEIAALSNEQINLFEKEGHFIVNVDNQEIELTLDDVEIISEDIPGWLVTNEGNLTVALDITVNDDLKYEGIARELVNRIQNIRKESGFDVTDKINMTIGKHPELSIAIKRHMDYIKSQTLTKSIEIEEKVDDKKASLIQIDNDIVTKANITRIV